MLTFVPVILHLWSSACHLYLIHVSQGWVGADGTVSEHFQRYGVRTGIGFRFGSENGVHAPCSCRRCLHEWVDFWSSYGWHQIGTVTQPRERMYRKNLYLAFLSSKSITFLCVCQRRWCQRTRASWNTFWKTTSWSSKSHLANSTMDSCWKRWLANCSESSFTAL